MSLQNWAEGIESHPLIPEGARLKTVPRRPVLNKRDAPGYRTIATQYSCIPEVGHPWDPDVVRAIWKFAPEFVPMWERRVLLPQGTDDEHDAVVTGRHALGRVIRNRKGWLPELRVTMPTMPCQGLKFDQPNDLAFVHEDELEEGQSRDLPGPYLPFDNTILRKAADLALGYSMSDKEYREFLQESIVQASFEDYLQRVQDKEEEMEARDREFLPYAQKQMDKVSDVMAKEFLASRGQRERERKPFIVVP